MQDERGRITNHARAQQQRDYSNLRYGTITPMDIDGFIEYHNRAYVLWELKLKAEVSLSKGQWLALERLTDDLACKKSAICIIAVHNVFDPTIDIPADKALVTWYRRDRIWHIANEGQTLKQTIDDFLCEIDTDAERPIELPSNDGRPSGMDTEEEGF